MTTVHPDAATIRTWMVEQLVDRLGVDPSALGTATPLIDLGVGSKDAVVLAGELGEFVGRPVSPVELFEHPTIDQLAAYLTGDAAQDSETAVEDASRGRTDEPIAVVGIGCRFPGGADDPDALWELLADGRNGVREVPAERWAPWDDGEAAVGEVLARTTRWGGLLDDIAGFDAEFFGVPPREATAMDPQQRILLEVAWEALERAGIPPESLRRSRTGVFVGACLSEYGFLSSADLTAIDAWSNTGGALSIIANRLSYLLDLRGPSLTIDTACSSSLVAVHLATQSLRLGESDTALVGGVNLLLSPSVFRGFDASGALSPTGTCRAFDAAADGFVRGEGCGVVVLKRLSDAQRDGDDVLAVVRGSAVNQDGLSNGLFAPNPAAQMAVLRSAYAAAGVAPRDVDYVEAHGTGTPLGDPIEARALGTVLGRGRRADAPLLIGSVKGNLGHLEGGAGIAGMIKTVLALRHRVLPATPHHADPNPHIPFDQLRLAVVQEQRPWPAVDRPRRAGVSSFGFGGTNAHIVLEEAPPAVYSAPPAAEPVTTLTLSALSAPRLAAWAQRLADWFDGAGAGCPLPAVAAALAVRRPSHAVTASVAARDAAGAAAALRALAAGETHAALTPVRSGALDGGTVFVFSGQGAQWAGMGRTLLAEEPAFAEAVDRLEPQFRAEAGFSLREALAAGLPFEGDARLQPALVGLQLALAQTWRAHGVEPDAVIGHSVGEVTAAVVSGALTVAEGLRVVAARGALMAERDGLGAVAMLGVDAETAAEIIAPHAGVEIAVLAAAGQTGIAGPPAAVDAVIREASVRNVFARRVDMRVASHTALMDPILGRLTAALEDLAPSAPSIPFYSTVRAGESAPHVDARYWAENVRRPVDLRGAVAAAAHHGTFIEISAHPVLTHAIAGGLPEGALVLGTLVRDGDDLVALRRSVAAVRPPRPAAPAAARGAAGLLPTVPWQHRPYWLAERSVGRPSAAGAPGGPGDGEPADWSYRLDWVARETPEEVPAPARSWVVIGDGAEAWALAAALGEGATTVSANEFATPETIPSAAAMAALTAAERVVHLPVPAADPLDPRAGYAMFATGRALVTALVAHGAGRLHLVTRNAQPIDVGDRADPAHAVLWGLGRTLALEHPEHFGGLLDVDASVPAVVLARYLCAEAAQADGRDAEDQVVYRGGERHVPRLRPARGATPAGDGVVDAEAAHLVVGATGNLGPTVIRELVRAGARTVVAVSRNPGDRLEPLASELAECGATLHVVAADATDEASIAPLLRRFGADLPRLSTVHLAAFGGGPVTLAQMSEADVAAMFAPKLDAVAVLDRLTRTVDIDDFVLFTSISGLTGSRWLGHYAATTTYLDAYAYARRAAGLPATVINWGLWRSLHETQDAVVRETTEGSGLVPMEDGIAIRALPRALAPGAPVRSVVVAADWPVLAAAYRVRAALRIVDDLDAPAEHDTADGATELRTALRAAPLADRESLLGDAVAEIVAAALGLDSPALLDRGAGFFQAGMDSLTVVTVARTLALAVGEELPTSVVFDYPSADGLTAHLAGILPELLEAREAEAATDDYDDFSEDELLAQLAERLG
ncbi:polyketide synthase [Tsukamurella pulmonis]|uniref:Phthiocerol/phenolphthiocerol synthesis type-I polyketide synthase B n=1 Tax=Tsukamurella pulmonis TaxID=47312 RepID=A0A1H1CAU3_9ACTN|nr:type I polyketide synthase [Tsukamurella pulmonis]KXO89985.1 polyketide synthase [Tsukamurella pulmonis]SDQ61303.1 phthiocerol/phenolphthiocerol synthesis type-I polyketide synthase B [Tsukamurella pulmonis]SUP23959.1 Beta-ketoacyl-acyl-carrier-protein synthase I [Tsukamurella pulmonis]